MKSCLFFLSFVLLNQSLISPQLKGECKKKRNTMGVDLRQVVAGILTITMFVMLGQMLHRDYFDANQVLNV